MFYRTHRETIDDCIDCEPGYYCPDRAATSPAGMCKAGHICYGRALNDDPVYNDGADNTTQVTYGMHQRISRFS